MPTAKILLADDDKVTLSVLGASLGREGYRVLTAMDAMQVVMAAHRSGPDAIILDVMMPGGGGLDVLKKLKASSETQLIPVIAISTSRDASLPAQVLASGAEAFLPKPVQFADLRDLLHRLLDPPPAPGSDPGTTPSRAR